jgi:DNA-binding response OmpR family regulator
MNDYVSKPIRPEELADALNKAVTRGAVSQRPSGSQRGQTFDADSQRRRVIGDALHKPAEGET